MLILIEVEICLIFQESKFIYFNFSLPQQPNSISENQNIRAENALSIISANIITKTRLKERLENSAIQHFSIWNSFCFNFCILNTKKRNFIQLVSQVIDNKLSVEYILELCNNFQLLRKLVLTQEQNQKFDSMNHLSLEEQLKEFDIKL